MCNRYRLTHSERYLAARFQASGDINDTPRYNIAPTQPVLPVRREHGEKVRRFTTMRWGLIPHWAKDASIGNRTLNARSESVTKTPAFRDSILTKRCLIPADGFYEWVAMGPRPDVHIVRREGMTALAVRGEVGDSSFACPQGTGRLASLFH